MKKGKRRLWCKRNVIIALIVAIVGSISAYFFISCGQHDFDDNPDIESISALYSTALPTPNDGSDPSKHDPMKNAFYAIYAMDKLDSFTTESSGTTVSKAIFNVTQNISARRVVLKNEVFKENVSHSGMKSVGTRTFVKNGNYVIHNADKVSSLTDVVWEDEAHKVSEANYLEKFGFVANSITAYVLTEETILSAEYLGEENGIYTFYYNLDLVKATGKLGLEMRTMAGSSSMPIFEKASITVKMDSNWLVTEVQTSSIYTVNILGGVTCTESVTEKFSNYNADVKIPDYDFYNYYVDAEVEDPEEATLTATDYIMQGFGDYISGTKPIKANLSVNSKDLGLKLSVNLQLGINLEDLSALSLRLDVNELTYNDLFINGLFLAYENQNIYIKIGDFKAVSTLEELSSKAQEICSLLNIDLSDALNLFESFESFDASNLLANAIIVENEKSAIVTLPINFGELSLNAVLTFNTEDGIVPEKLSATLKQTEIELSVNDTLTVTETGEGYNAITPLLNLISNLSNVKAEISIGDINALLSYNLNSSCLDVYVDELNLGEINLGEIKAKLINGEVYLNVKGIPAKFALCDIQPVLSKISAIIGKEITLPSLDGLKNINLEEIITTAISSLTAKFENNTLSLSTEIFGETILIDLLVTENGYELGDLSLILRGTQITARLTNKEITKIETAELNNYYDIVTLLDLIDNNEINLKVNTFGLDINLCFNLTDLSLIAKTNLYGEELYAKLINDDLFISYLGLNVTASLNDLDLVLAKLSPILGEISLPDFSALSIQDIINSIVVSDGDLLTISANISDLDISLVLSKDNGLKVNNISIVLGEQTISASPVAKAQYNMPTGNYYDIVTLLDLIDNNEINLKVNAFGLDIDLCFNLTDLSLITKTNLYGEELYAKLVNDDLFISYLGLNVTASLNDLDLVLAKLSPILGEISLPDFSALSIQDIINSIVVSDGDLLTISANISDLDISLVLSKDNGLKVNNISIVLGEQTISASPVAKAQYNMPTGNYYDIVTLLDLIDNNGNISLTVDLLNINALVTINLVEKQIYAKSSDLELNFDLTEKVIYVRYPGVLAKLSLNDIDYVVNEIKPIIAKFVDVSALDKINFNSLNEISIEEILSAITVVDNQNELSISIALGDAIINALISTKNKEMNLSFAKVTLGETEIAASPIDNALALNFDKSLDYIDLKELVAQFAPAVRSVVTEENLYAEMTATIVLRNLTLEIVECKIKIADVNTAPKANVFVSVKVTETKNDGSKKESTHDITLVYLDPSLVAEGAINTYFTYDDKSNTNVLEGTFTTVKFYDTIEIIKQIYANIPELSEALKPFIMPDENGMPTLPQIDIAINQLINDIFFENGILTADINGTTINENLSSSALISISTDSDKLVLNVSKVTFGDASISLKGKVGKADLEIISENDFVINPSDNASDFSSINELLLCLQNTAKERHFYIYGKINLTGIIDLTDKVDIDIYIDVVDGKTYVKAILDRKPYSVPVLSINAWQDYKGTGTLYYDPEEEIIYIHNHYTLEKKVIVDYKWGIIPVYETTYPEYDEYLRYTIDEFMADPMTPILKLIRLNSYFEDMITKEINSGSSSSKSTATIDNTLLKYSYNGTDKFTINLDLEPLLKDIKKLDVDIYHDKNCNFNKIDASVGILGIMTIKLNASLTTQDNSYGAEIAVREQRSILDYN